MVLDVSYKYSWKLESFAGKQYLQHIKWIIYVSGVFEEQKKMTNSLKTGKRTLAGMVQWIESQPVNRKVASLIPGQGACLGCGPGPHWEVYERQPI